MESHISSKIITRKPNSKPSKASKIFIRKKKTPFKTLKSNPVMQSHISSFDSSRTSHLWTLGDTRCAIPLLGEEGKIDAGYFLDDIHPLFFHGGGCCGLSPGPIGFLGMIGGKTTRTAEDGLDLEYDCHLVGFGGLDDDQDHDQIYIVVVGLGEGVDFHGFNNILGLNLMNHGLSGESGPVSILNPFSEISFGSGLTKVRLTALSVPRPVVLLGAIRIPVLLSYSPRDGDLELYVPTFNARVDRPPVAVNFSQYLLVSQNYKDCEILLFNRHTREVIVYSGLDNTVVNLPNLQQFRRNCFRVSGRFQKVVLNGGQSDYRVFVIAFHRKLLPCGDDDDDDDEFQLGTQLWLYYRQPNQQDWTYIWYLITDFIQRPRAFFVIEEFFAWVDVESGRLFSIEDWNVDPADGVPFPGPTLLAQLQFRGAHCIFSVEDGERTCLIVHHYDMFSVFDLSILKVLMLGVGYQVVYNLVRRVTLSERNFYCSLFNVGFSAAPPPLGASTINAIFVGGYQGDCSRLNNHAEIVDQQDADLVTVDVDFECLRLCHDPLIDTRPLICRCQSAFLLLPLHLVARMIPDVAPFLR